jgi:tetratricopeptide (TPR) repeat protein
MSEKKIHPLPLIIIISLFSLPLIFLYFKTTSNNRVGETVLSQMAIKDIASYNNYINLATGYINSNQPEKSLAPLEQAKALNPNSAVVYNNLGVAYIMLKRIDEGIAACRRAIELDPSFQLAKNNLNWGLAEKEKLKGK